MDDFIWAVKLGIQLGIIGILCLPVGYIAMKLFTFGILSAKNAFAEFQKRKQERNTNG